ncbi:glucose-6-phosphate dehydrogenase [Aquabacterium sp.]|uniref:glucose-6-phosphate dehydrogenase n=1 Tax=Aquabacterium sp. TaxID=1872578 RepID=UPI0025BFA925|nr:glucose-6-phosphate dehydrogenase [Aquabacterium sp.]
MQAVPELDLVIFGGTGDLAMRKLLPALMRLQQDELLPARLRVIGVAREPLTQAAFQALAHDRIASYQGKHFDPAGWDRFVGHIDYARVDATDAASFDDLAQRLQAEPQRDRVFYLSTAPRLFSTICDQLAAKGLITERSRVVLEKPLGHDLASSRDINDAVGGHFGEQQIYRIDHYLGKEPVQNLLALRFGNALFEPLWRRESVRDVQITVSEELGVESRGDFYDQVGAMRDMVQNHLLQLLCIVAMEPPASISADAVRDEKLKILRALRPIEGADVAHKTVRGQYRAGASGGKPVPGYLEEERIKPDSTTETFVAIRAEIDTWRWAGVPFFLRTGKRMPQRVAEIVVNFRSVPHSIFGQSAESMNPNRMVIRMQPDEKVELHLLAKQPGDVMNLQPVHLNLDFSQSFKSRSLEAYERLLMDVMRGNLTLFVRRDEQEAAWRWVEPIMNAWKASTDKPKPYTAGTWGPAASSALLGRDGLAWHEEI